MEYQLRVRSTGVLFASLFTAGHVADTFLYCLGSNPEDPARMCVGLKTRASSNQTIEADIGPYAAKDIFKLDGNVGERFYDVTSTAHLQVRIYFGTGWPRITRPVTV